MKKCNRCSNDKALDEFHKNPSSRDGRRSICKDCTASYSEKYYVDNRDKCSANSSRYYQENKVVFLERTFKNSLKRKFNISSEEYLEQLDRQNGVCAICGNMCSTGKRLAVDHDHKCCEGNSCGSCIRGLLCYKCNTGLGFFGDDFNLLKKAVEYIEKGGVMSGLDKH